LPASDAGSAAAAWFPASPVATTSAPRLSAASPPPLPVTPRGMPVSTGFGGSPPGAIRTTRLSVAVVT
jgi:hypothetical protein